MNRREFLKNLLIGSALVAPSTRFIFDMGANLYRPEFKGVVGTLGEIEVVDFHTMFRELRKDRTKRACPAMIDGVPYYTMIVPPNNVAMLQAELWEAES